MFGAGKTRRGGGRRNKERFDKNKVYMRKRKKGGGEKDEITQKQSEYCSISSEQVKRFSDFPLSKRTLDGLEKAGFTEPTDVQRESIGLSLQGHDILGAAKTGSGKTLAFLVPILEALWRARWTQYDGMGALIISPTRELAYQTFDVLRRVGAGHDFSAGLVIGGKHVKEEAEQINNTNVVICTPGRLLQHMDETYNFNADNLQILVLDEADRILDLGFRDTMNAIIENLPQQRQTLLFSATQTKSVKDLARLSLKDAMFVSVHEKAAHSTPQSLQQSYIVCELEQKMNVLWSFIKHHLKHKTLVFLSSCKQTRFVHEVFRRLRPGVTVLALHGAMQQMKRVAVYDEFCRKQHAVLFATDVAARGLDFPAVNWVVQMDCPEDALTYIHRAGRTARYEKDGEALLFLLPSEEEAMLRQLQDKKIPISKIQVNPKKHWTIDTKLQSLLASDVQLKEFAQRSFVSYLRSVFLMKNKAIFNINKINTDTYSSSLGLAVAPRIRFLSKANERAKLHSEAQSGDVGDSNDSDGGETKKSVNAEAILMKAVDQCNERIKKRKKSAKTQEANQEDKKKDEQSVEKSNLDESKEDELESTDSVALGFDVDEDEELFTLRRTIVPDDEEVPVTAPTTSTQNGAAKRSAKKQLSKVVAAQKLLRKNIHINTKVIFDEEGEVAIDPMKQQKTSMDADATDDYEGGLDIDSARRRMQQEDLVDKEIHRQKVKQKHKEERLKEKERKRDEKEKTKRRKADDEEIVVTLGGMDGDSDDGGAGYDSHDDDRYASSGDEEEEEEEEYEYDNDSDKSL